MQTQRVNRTDAERVYIVVRNVEATSITTGMGVAIAIAGNSFDGNAAVRSVSTANTAGYVGVALNDIASNAYGIVQSWGFAASVLLSNTGTSVTINQGDALFPSPLAGALASGAPTFANSGNKYILASNVPVAISAQSYVSGFVRCL